VCIVLSLRRGNELWIAANRDERLDRTWQPPALLSVDPPVFGGRDLVGGGSWLAVNLSAGFVAAVTNAALGAAPGQRSRGALVVDLATAPGVEVAATRLASEDVGRYGPFNILLADSRQVLIATNYPEPRSEHPMGAVVALGNAPLTDPGDRVEAAARRVEELAAGQPRVLRRQLAALLADHDGPDPLCRHGDRYGTVCSSILMLEAGRLAGFGFCPGKPCVTEFSDLSA
jgi:uncharacterized protein with NRDE domain